MASLKRHWLVQESGDLLSEVFATTASPRILIGLRVKNLLLSTSARSHFFIHSQAALQQSCLGCCGRLRSLGRDGPLLAIAAGRHWNILSDTACCCSGCSTMGKDTWSQRYHAGRLSDHSRTSEQSKEILYERNFLKSLGNFDRLLCYAACSCN